MRFWTWSLIFFSCVAFILSAYNLFNVFTHPIKYKAEIVECSTDYDLAPELIASVINVESSFKQNARSIKNAIGLMQIKLTTANYLNELNKTEQIDEHELFNVKTNIKYGTQYLKYLMSKFYDINTSLAAYNAGETKVRSWLRSGSCSLDGKTLTYIPFEETRNYVKKVNNNLSYYKKIFNK